MQTPGLDIDDFFQHQRRLNFVSSLSRAFSVSGCKYSPNGQLKCNARSRRPPSMFYSSHTSEQNFHLFITILHDFLIKPYWAAAPTPPRGRGGGARRTACHTSPYCLVLYILCCVLQARCVGLSSSLYSVWLKESRRRGRRDPPNIFALLTHILLLCPCTHASILLTFESPYTYVNVFRVVFHDLRLRVRRLGM